MTNHFTPWQPDAAARSREGIRASAGYAGRLRVLEGIRDAVGFGRGDVVSMGIVLKEGET